MKRKITNKYKNRYNQFGCTQNQLIMNCEKSKNKLA